ncbi:MAG: cation transporter, partial [Marinilabiliales bacterium]
MDKNKAGYTEGFVSILVNTLLFGLKLWAGIVS